jgi:hypothetical protein
VSASNTYVSFDGASCEFAHSALCDVYDLCYTAPNNVYVAPPAQSYDAAPNHTFTTGSARQSVALSHYGAAPTPDY